MKKLDNILRVSENIDRMVKPFQSTINISNKIGRLTKTYNKGTHISEYIDASKLVTEFMNKISLSDNLKLDDSLLNVMDNFKLSQSINDKIFSFEDSIQVLNKFNNFFTDIDKVSLVSIIQNSASIDIEQAEENNKSKVEESIEEILDEASQVISSITDSSEHAFTIVNNFLYRVFNSRRVKTLTRVFIMDLVLQILIAIATQPFDNQPEPSINTSIENTTNNNYNIQNQCPLYISSIIIELRTHPRNNSKVIAAIPEGTEITVIKENRVWALVTYRIENEIYNIGWIKVEKIEN